MSDEEIISLNRMKLFARSSDLSVVTAKDMEIVVNLVETQQKEIEELKEKNNNLANIKIAEWQDALTNAISKDKIREIIEGDYTNLWKILEIKKMLEE